MDSGARLQGRYVLRRHIGSGRTTEVWEAWDERLSRAVAVKLVSADPPPEAAFSRRFQEEARAAAAVFHPHVVIIYDCDETCGEDGRPVPYIVMEFLEGETLADRIHRGAPPVGEAVQVCAQIADALAAAHRAGVAHRDLKPANVFLTSEGVKVLDFGIGRAARDPIRPPAAGLWSATAEPPPGTPAYLAQEGRLGRSPATAAADVYALGVVLTEALTGRRALDAPLPEGIPVEVAVLCSRCRARDPAARPSAADVSEILATASGWAEHTPPGRPRPQEHWLPHLRAKRILQDRRAARGVSDQPPATADPAPTPADPSWLPAGPARPTAQPASSAAEHASPPDDPAWLPADPIPALADPSWPTDDHASPPAGPAWLPADPASTPADPASAPAGPVWPAGDPVWPPADGRTAHKVPSGMTGEFSFRLARPDARPGGEHLIRRHAAQGRQAPQHLTQEYLTRPGMVRAEPEKPVAGEPEAPVRDGSSHVRLRRFLFDGALTVAGCAVTVFLLSAQSSHRRSPDPPAPAGPTVSHLTGKTPGPGTPAAPATPAPLDREIAALTRIRPIIERGLAAGEIRSDVALDLTNVITNLQKDLIAGQRTDPQQGVTELQTKILTRLREGGLTQSRADELNLALSAVSQRHVALRGSPVPGSDVS
ncbi:MAG: eukaryotic-like serine/threonine-protein kinase [Streptosporangiaceae bacterium]|nr:eukaryotic-like serine/threonine-protein kinase [Streptosporangiaceae bacterium]